MKVNKFKFKHLLKLHLLNSKAYEHPSRIANSDLVLDSNLTKILGDLKKILHIIFQFHIVNKKILFIGLPKKLESKINNATHHIALPNDFDLQGILLNGLRSAKNSKIKNLSGKFRARSVLPKLEKRPALIVLFSHEKKYNVVSESYIAKIPVITFITDEDSHNVIDKSSYSVSINMSKLVLSSDNNLFFLGLNFLFKTFIRKSSKYHTRSRF